MPPFTIMAGGPSPTGTPPPFPPRCAALTPDPFGYRCEDTGVYTYIPGLINTGIIGGDQVVPGIPIGFSFNFYGLNYTVVNVGANGNLQFTTTNDTYFNTALPHLGMRQMIAGFWNDLDPPACQPTCRVRYATVGTAPNRIFVVEWYQIPHWWEQTVPLTWEIQLHETTNDIYFLFQSMSTGYGNGNQATLGIQNGVDSAFQYSYNEAVVYNDLAIRFYNSGTPGPTWTPTPTPPPGTLVAIEDAYIALFYPTTPFGSADPNYLQSQVGRGSGEPCTTYRQSLLKFDVAGLSGDVTTATLTLQATYSNAGPSGTIAGIWPIGDSWDQWAVTWNTRPISTGPPLTTVSAPFPSWGYPLVFPSTPALVAYLNSQRPANGGDGLASFITGFVDCPPLTAFHWHNASRESGFNAPPLLNVELAMPPTSTPAPSPTPTTPYAPTSTATGTPVLPPTHTPTPTVIPYRIHLPLILSNH